MLRITTFLLLIIPILVYGIRKPISIEKAIKMGYISLDAKGKGGHSGWCVQMKITNKHNDSLYVDIEAGRRLNSVNDEEQDILVAKEQIVKIKAKESKTINVFGFCCQASNHSPGKESKFSVGKMADSSLVALAEFCNKNKFSENDIQNSVWCVSDNHSVAGIPANNEPLREFVADLTKQEIPWYQKEYAPSTGLQTFSNKTDKISGNINYTISSESLMQIKLIDSKGNTLQVFSNNKIMPRGNYDYWFELQVTNWPKGKYFIHFYCGTQMINKKEFVI